MARSSARVQPWSNPCRTAMAPRKRPRPKMERSMASVSLAILAESKCRTLPLNHGLITPSALPSSAPPSPSARTRKKGPRDRSRRLSPCALDDSIISDMLGIREKFRGVFGETAGGLGGNEAMVGDPPWFLRFSPRSNPSLFHSDDKR